MFLRRLFKPKIEVNLNKENLMYLVQGYRGNIVDNNESLNIKSPGLSAKDIAQLYYTQKLHDLYEHYKPVFTTRSGGFVISRDIWSALDRPNLIMSRPVYVVEGQNYMGVGRHPDDVGAEWGEKDASD